MKAGIGSPKHDAKAKEMKLGGIRTSPIGSPPGRDLDVHAARHKFQRAGRKAAHTVELSRAFDTFDFRAKIDSFLQRTQESRTEDQLEEFLTAALKFKFFLSYSDTQQRQLAKIARSRSCEKDEILFRQEEAPDALYLVLSGRCSLYKVQGETKKLIIVAGQGDALGDATQLDDRMRRSCTAQISSDQGAELIMFTRADLDALSHQWRIAEEKAKTDFIMHDVPVLNSVQRDIVANLSPYFEKMRVPKDSIIYRQQDDAGALYFIWEGEVQLVKRIDLVKVTKKSP
jgi:CRP-like cAMP-binding protein